MRAVLVTGAAGGIGRALCAAFRDVGWWVVGTDRVGTLCSNANVAVPVNLETLACEDGALAQFQQDVRGALGGSILTGLVNNAAAQLLNRTEQISLDEWRSTIETNLTAPFRLVQAFLPDLEAAKGVVLNIGSVHAKATKPGFVSYATSKAALHGLTRALAVDLGPRVRVVCLAPAAVSTEMLLAGFEGTSERFSLLQQIHPAGRIAEPSEIARAAVALMGEPFLFATGTSFYLDGGILSRLHDPA